MSPAVTVTIAPCMAHEVNHNKLMLSQELMAIAHAMSEDCGGEVPIHVLDGFGHEAVVIGGHSHDEDDIELF